MALVDDADELYAAKGKTVVHLDLKADRPDRATLRKLVLGPTGNLRAPTLRTGRTLIVGFDQPMYEQVFG